MNRIAAFFLIISAFNPASGQIGSDSSVTSGWAYLPIVYYTPETELAFGGGSLYFSHSAGNTQPSSVTGTLVYTTNRQFLGELTTSVFFGSGTYWHTGNFYYEVFPNQFYGIGNESSDSARESYTADILKLNPAVMIRLDEHAFAGPLLHIESWSLHSLETGGTLSTGRIAGSRPTTVVGIGAQFTYEGRDNIFSATDGRYLQAAVLISTSALGSSYDFSRWQLDMRRYLPLGHDHVLAIQMLFHTTTGTVPFRFMPKLGGQNVLRGFFEGRYRDDHMAAFQTEYRSPFLYRFGVALFGGIGEVANRIGRFGVHGVKAAAGAGIRFAFIPKERIFLRLDYGFSNISNGVYITMNEAI